MSIMTFCAFLFLLWENFQVIVWLGGLHSLLYFYFFILCIWLHNRQSMKKRDFNPPQNTFSKWKNQTKQKKRSCCPSSAEPDHPWAAVCLGWCRHCICHRRGYHMSRAKPGGMISAFVWARATWGDSGKYCTPVSLGEACCWPSVLAWA